MKPKTTLIICLFILLLASAATLAIFLTEPSARRESATKETAMLVEVTDVRRGAFRPTISAMGTVQPAREIVLSPRISGEIVAISPSFAPGGFVAKDEILLQIDPADYRHELRQRESELRQAEADLALEMGRQNVAEQGFDLVGETISPEHQALVLREPQLNVALARVESAEAAVQLARIDLQRAELKAPFDAHILARHANVGSQVAPGDNLGRLVGRDVYWIETAVPLWQLRWIRFPEQNGERGSKARVRDRAAWSEGVFREGYVFQLIGSLDETTRMARVLVEVPDPLAYETNDPNAPALILGGFVEVLIEGQEIEDTVRLERDYLRDGDTVWIMEDGKLRIRNVDVAVRDARFAYIASGLNTQDNVVTTNISTPTDGAPLRTSESDRGSQQTPGNLEASNGDTGGDY